MLIVIDTNILISSALMITSPSRKVFEKIILSHIMLRSSETLHELIKTIYKPKFDKYFVKNPLLREELILSYTQIGRKIIITETVTACRDPKDNIYLELALSGKAELIITGDKDLLVLNPFQGIPIISSSEFLGRYD